MKNFLPNLETIKEIRKDESGIVFEVRKTDNVGNEKELAALKVISVPSSMKEYDSLKTSGYDDGEIQRMFSGKAGEIADGFRFMSKFKGNRNILNYEEPLSIPHEDGKGFDILIFTEFSDVLPSYLSKNDTSMEEWLKIGIDVCEALEVFHNQNMVHRNIKLQTIFVDSQGNFKLGEFGIMCLETHGEIGANPGAYSYIAPEIYKGETYNQTTDIYSLGLILYWLFNQKRLPFFPLPPKVTTVKEMSLAIEKRLTGAPLTPPKDGTDRINEIILKACAYSPKDRYQTAAEFKEALRKEYDALMYLSSFDKTQNAYQNFQSTQPQEQYQSGQTTVLSGGYQDVHSTNPQEQYQSGQTTVLSGGYQDVHSTNPQEQYQSGQTTVLSGGYQDVHSAKPQEQYQSEQTTVLGGGYQDVHSTNPQEQYQSGQTTVLGGGYQDVHSAKPQEQYQSGQTTVLGGGYQTAPNNTNQTPTESEGKKNKKSKSKLIIAIVLSIILALGISFGVFYILGQKNDDTREKDSESEQSYSDEQADSNSSDMEHGSSDDTSDDASDDESSESTDVSEEPAFSLVGDEYVLTSIGSNPDKNFIIPEYYDGKPVTAIGVRAFRENQDIESVIIPSTVINIDNYAFYNCENLKTVEIKSDLINIGDWAFSGCKSMKTIELPSALQKIGEYAFFSCSGIENIYIPDNVTSIGNFAFAGCDNLTSLTVDSLNTTYKSKSNCIILTDEKKLVAGCQNSSIPLDGSVKIIGEGAFSSCYNLTNITLPNCVTTIENNAFEYCISLSYIKIPQSVSFIGKQAFQNCDSLANIDFLLTNLWHISETIDGESTSISVSDSALTASFITGDYAKYYWMHK